MYGIGHVGGLPSNPLSKKTQPKSKPKPEPETSIDVSPIDDKEGTNTMPPTHDTNSRHRIINLTEDDNVVEDDHRPYRILNLADDG